ncbi:glycosyltransferase family 1 protein [Lichenicola cladoniae]|uniref:Glycosyltransferase family 1 protein n=1 Tax=Lichenicola cladoniae TaxID=1484109 RepID=A0A6M8HN47_9PROT|nr:glycosyltransferase family 1 protein [Lichenicola cladoniae]NPD67284.1 glycosyltransferase family 1 protein [Acetobacteraceae bacterium]QKE89788.1 glycosyltransferase family 1 protein [Lichenicola cladoniae]
MKRILFVLKSREAAWGYSAGSSGLSNSVRFVVDMLSQRGIEAKSVEVADNNAIDAAVTAYRPTHVIVEAFWVVPEKFDVLKTLHPTVRWLVRDHSETPFLANEGIAFGWTIEYLRRGVEVMCNSPRARADMRDVAAACGLPESLITYGPNFYPCPAARFIVPKPVNREAIDIGCFGAVRPLKNHMAQAIAAIAFADAARVKLRFHVNATRIEGNGDPILKNLRSLFDATPRYSLIEHDWMSHHDFLEVIRQIDVSMQVSFTETFNIVAADAVAMSVPVLASPELPWLGAYAHALPTSTASMARSLMAIWNESHAEQNARLHRQRHELIGYSQRSEDVWVGRFGPRF